MISIDMPMPKGCSDCPFVHYEWDECIPWSYINFMKYKDGKEGYAICNELDVSEYVSYHGSPKKEGRHPECPLEEENN